MFCFVAMTIVNLRNNYVVILVTYILLSVVIFKWNCFCKEIMQFIPILADNIRLQQQWLHKFYL